MEPKLRIQVISESQFTIGGHGVHSAFLDHVEYLQAVEDVDLVVNGKPDKPARIVHAHTIGPYSVSALMASHGTRVITAHLTPESFLGSIVGSRYLHRLSENYLAWFYNRADLILSVSSTIEERLRQIGVRKPIATIPNWINHHQIAAAAKDREKIRARLGLSDNDTLVVSVGQVQPRKGVTDFLKCAQMLPGLRFMWIGGAIFGPISEKGASLERALRDAGSNVNHAGSVTRQTVYQYLAAADIYVTFSKQETSGISVLEAAASGLPLVLSDLPVFHEIYGSAGQYGSFERCVEALDDLAQDRQLRKLWAKRAAETATKYRWESNGPRLLATYNDLTNRMILPTPRRTKPGG